MNYFFKITVSSLMLLGSVFVLPGCGKSETKKSASTQEVEEKVPVTAKLPTLLDLGAKKCIPCKKMAPILNEMETEFKGQMNVKFIDVWQPENREEAVKHNIISIPTQIFFDPDGKELWRHVGFISKADMLAKWKELGYSFKPTVKEK